MAKKSRCLPRTVLHEQKNHFAIGRDSERCSYHTDLSRFVLPISDPSALNLSQFVGFQDSPNLSKIEKVAETCEFDGKEPLFVEKTIAISTRVFGWKWQKKAPHDHTLPTGRFLDLRFRDMLLSLVPEVVVAGFETLDAKKLRAHFARLTHPWMEILHSGQPWTSPFPRI